MKNMTLKEILEIPQFNMYIYPDQLASFILNKKNLERVQEELKDCDIQVGDEISEKYGKKDTYELFSEFGPEVLLEIGQKMSGKVRELLLREEGKINIENLILFLGDTAAYNLRNTYPHKKEDNVSYFLEYADGEEIDLNNISENTTELRGVSGKLYKINELRTQLAETILIANSLLPNRKITIPTYYHFSNENGEDLFRKAIITREDLAKTAKLNVVISNLNYEKFPEYIEKGLLAKHDVIRFLTLGIATDDVAVNLMVENSSIESDILKKVFNVANKKSLVDSSRISLLSKLLLYSAEKVDIQELEASAQKYTETNEQISKEKLAKLSKYYKGNINKISELLTHNVLDFTQSMEFLEVLAEEKAITEEDKKYLIEIMSNFKTNELLNNSQNEKRNGIKPIVSPSVHSHGVTIDPELRKKYFKSVGDVKSILVNGQDLIRDDSEGATKKNSLDGYQLILIPDKKIAVLEKFYEVTRDKEGNTVYKKDKDGNLVAAIENATYVMPIAMAKDFVEKKNKQELRKSPYVVTVSHTMNWVENTEQAMRNVAGRAGLQVEFEKENTEKWQQTIIDNYKMLKEKRDKNIDELL